MQPYIWQSYSFSEIQTWFLGGPTVKFDSSQLVSTDFGLTCVAQVRPRQSVSKQVSIDGPSYFIRPDTFCWLPSRLQNGDGKESTCGFDTKELLKINGNRLHLLAGTEGSNRWYYVGEGGLVRSFCAGAAVNKYEFELSRKLSRETWMQMGGYPEWLLSVGEYERYISKSDSVDEILQREWGTIAPELEITRYEGDSLFAVVDGEGSAVVSYQNQNDAETFSRNSDYSGQGDKWTTFPCSNGWDYEAPAMQVIGKERAIEIIKTFISSGVAVGLSSA
jgi:hypothetical protein